ncbi:MAG: GntR family transcriptional regulator [Terriglobia bacterium]
MRLRIPENLTQRAYRAIRDEILKGRLNGKQRLTEAYFAERLGVSKSPIREALNRLEAEGLIIIEPRRGASVANFSADDIKEIYELREILEGAAVHDMLMDEKTCARLRASLDAAKEALRASDKVAYILADADFHRVVAQAARNSRLRRILENMHGQMLVLRHRTFELSSDRSVLEHEGILQAIEGGDTDLASRRMTQHVRAVRKKLLAHLENAGTTDSEEPPAEAAAN